MNIKSIAFQLSGVDFVCEQSVANSRRNGRRTVASWVKYFDNLGHFIFYRFQSSQATCWIYTHNIGHAGRVDMVSRPAMPRMRDCCLGGRLSIGKC